MDRHFARHIVSWYAGVPAHQVAKAERVSVAAVRAARQALGRGAELGGTREATVLGHAPAGALPGQLSFAGYDGLMRTNRSVCG